MKRIGFNGFYGKQFFIPERAFRLKVYKVGVITDNYFALKGGIRGAYVLVISPLYELIGKSVPAVKGGRAPVQGVRGPLRVYLSCCFPFSYVFPGTPDD